jgi:hypothetical protein
MKPAARALALAAMAGTLCAASVFAEESATTPSSDKNASAMRVVVDPETGEVRAPTSDELQALIQAEQAARAAERSTFARAAVTATAPEVMPEAKTVTRHANGMVSIRLGQESLSLVKAETDAQGKVRAVHANETSSVAPAQEK